MAPTRPTSSASIKGKKHFSSSSGKPRPSDADRRSATNKVSKSRTKAKPPPPKQQRTSSKKPWLTAKKKQRVYTEKELGIPKLNMIAPVGVEKPRGKKKGKVFVDDKESMMTILAMVNAEKEGMIESKLSKARQLEEIREARLKEAGARQEQRKLKLEETKDSIRKKRKRRRVEDDAEDITEATVIPAKQNKKRVSFG